MNLLLDHLWQSTAVLAVIGLLTLFFRGNGAGVRHALWTVASLKFLVPFAALNWLGALLSGIFALPLPAPVVQAVYGAAQPFSDGPVFDIMPAPASPNWLPFLAIWGIGALALLCLWTARRVALGQAVRAARDSDIAAPMRVKLSPTLMEPGLVGILRPVLLLPEGIADKLTAHELAAIISHEACHMRRRDNLLATLHMLVQAVFWFWPPLWWLGTRLIAERERACDEAVVAEGNDPHTYAETILKVCRYYVSSPLPCAAGISGAGLKKRMEDIMKNSVIARINLPRKALLAATAALLLALPIALGLQPMPVAMAQDATCIPQPVIHTRTRPPYPVDAKKNNQSGTVELQVTVARDGHASAAKITKSSGFENLDEVAASHVQKSWLWEPMSCASAQRLVRVEFNLVNGPGSGLLLRIVDDQLGRAGADPARMREDGEEHTVWLRREGQITGNVVTEAGVGRDDRSGKTVVNFRFTPEAQARFAAMTTQNVGKRIAVMVDGRIITAPVITEPMLEGRVQVSGEFTEEEARLLASRILAGRSRP